MRYGSKAWRKMASELIGEKLPTTRYVGSKQKVVSWIWDNISHLKFETFLDALSGTSVVGYYAKLKGKQVTCNDILKSNFLITKAIVENNSVRLSENDRNSILTKHQDISYPDFIQSTFKDIYYTDDENEWLDMAVTNIGKLNGELKRALAFYALFQACIIKRPYNLFHRKNLYMRFADVKRGFGNKATWDTPFPTHFANFASEVNSLVFDNGKKHKALNLDVFDIEGNFDLVYVDTPYFSEHSNTGVDYHAFYHFLEGLVDYENWGDEIDFKSKHRRLNGVLCVWTDKRSIHSAFNRLFEKFKDSVLVVSYRSGGIPTENEMVDLLKLYKKEVVVRRREYKYALSSNETHELLFIAT